VIKREIYLALLLLIFAPLSRGGGEESLTPFKIWQQSRGEWEKDPTEVAYVVFRCGTIFDVIGRVFIENGATLEHKANGNRMVERATALLSSARTFSFPLATS
jgi:hypothetical protein